MFQRAITFVKALSSTSSWYSSGPMTWRMCRPPSAPASAREAQKRAVSSRISAPARRKNSSSPVARQYRHTAYAMSALMCSSILPHRTSTIAPSGATTRSGVVSSPVSADSQAYSAPLPPMPAALARAAGKVWKRYISIARAASGQTAV